MPMANSRTIPMTHSGYKNWIQRLYNNSLAEFGSKKWGYETLALFSQSCLGAIAAMLILKNHSFDAFKMVELLFVTVLSMGFNAAVLVDMEAKPAFNILITSVLFSIIVIVINLI